MVRAHGKGGGTQAAPGCSALNSGSDPQRGGGWYLEPLAAATEGHVYSQGSEGNRWCSVPGPSMVAMTPQVTGATDGACSWDL